MHDEDGHITDFFNGSLYIQTLRKLPMHAPNKKTMTAITEFIGEYGTFNLESKGIYNKKIYRHVIVSLTNKYLHKNSMSLKKCIYRLHRSNSVL